MAANPYLTIPGTSFGPVMLGVINEEYYARAVTDQTIAYYFVRELFGVKIVAQTR